MPNLDCAKKQMMTINVKNKHMHERQDIDIYIGRGSVLETLSRIGIWMKPRQNSNAKTEAKQLRNTNLT